MRLPTVSVESHGGITDMPKKPGGSRRRILSLRVARNVRQRMNGVDLLAQLPDGIAALGVFDPQHRNVLDKLALGNEGARQQGRAALPQMRDDDVAFFIEEIERVLRPSGHLMLWIDKFCLAEGHHRRWMRRARSLKVVDVIAWNKLRPGMGRRARCQTEYLVVAQKEPLRAKDIWTDHSIPDSWQEHHDRALHPHAKPHQLTARLIRAVTERGDLVVDPCAGGYGVLDACLATGREFVGCDLMG